MPKKAGMSGGHKPGAVSKRREPRREKRREQRREQRFEPPRKVKVICGPHPVTASVLNYSLGGIALLCESALAMGEHFIIQPRGSSISLLVYRVQNRQPDPSGGFRIGAQLVCSNVAEMDLDELLKAILSL